MIVVAEHIKIHIESDLVLRAIAQDDCPKFDRCDTQDIEWFPTMYLTDVLNSYADRHAR